MTKEMDRKRDLSIPQKAGIILSDHGGEAWENIGFAEAFRDLSQKLAGAYSVSSDIYSQPASMARFEEGTSINRAKEFLDHVDYDPDKAASVVKGFAESHKPTKFYFGRDMPINLGVNIGSDEILGQSPDSKAHGRSPTIATLVQRAARLESLLDPEEGIPEAYATAQGQVGRALKVVEKAALLAYDWNSNWGRLDVDTAMDRAKSVLTKQKITRAGLVIALALAGCREMLPTITFSPGNTQIPISTEVSSTASSTETAIPPTVTSTETATVTPTPTDTPTPTPEPTKTPEPKPAEIILTDPTTLLSAIVARTSDCLLAPWQKVSSVSEIAEYRQLRDLLREKNIVFDNIFFTGGKYPDPACFIAVSGNANVPINRTYWYLTVDGELDTFHLIVKSP
jgi:hypothetical protein